MKLLKRQLMIAEMYNPYVRDKYQGCILHYTRLNASTGGESPPVRHISGMPDEKIKARTHSNRDILTTSYQLSKMQNEKEKRLCQKQ
jgi:hypothetical protein